MMKQLFFCLSCFVFVFVLLLNVWFNFLYFKKKNLRKFKILLWDKYFLFGTVAVKDFAVSRLPLL